MSKLDDLRKKMAELHTPLGLEWRTDDPPVAVILVTWRNPGVAFERYHGGGVWTNQGSPAAWAVWKGSEDLGEPLSRRRWELLRTIEPPR